MAARDRPDVGAPSGDGIGEVVRLRDVRRADLEFLFEMQRDPESSRMAMVVPRGREAFEAAWSATFASRAAGVAGVVPKAIELGDEMVGSIGCFSMEGLPAVGYAISRRCWGRGVATRALELLLEEVTLRPLHARCAATNSASLRVLAKNGFVVTGTRHSEGTERYLACEEVSLVLR